MNQGTKAQLFIGGEDLSGFVENATLDMVREVRESCPWGSSMKKRVGGRRDLKFSVSGPLTGEIDLTLFTALRKRTPAHLTFFPDGIVSYEVDCRIESYRVASQSREATSYEVLLVGSGAAVRLGQQWPTTVYAATKLLGLYFTEDFKPPEEGQPTWAPLNAGLSNTDLRSFCLDMSAHPCDARMFCLDNTTRTVWRRTTDTWVSVLTTAEARAIAGAVDTETLHCVITDDETGYVYAALQPPTSVYGKIYMMRSIDHGDTWTAATVTSRNLWYTSLRNIDAHGSLVVLTACNWPLSALAYFSEDGGITWSQIVFGSGNHNYNVIISHSDPGIWYGGVRGPGFYALRKYSVTGATSIIQPDEVIGPYGFAGGIWLHPTDPLIFCTLAHHPANPTSFVKTLDGGVTLAVNQVMPVGDITQFADGVIDNHWVQGCTANNRVAVYVSTNGFALTAKAGTNWDTPPYTGAIPKTCGGVTERGLWVKLVA